LITLIPFSVLFSPSSSKHNKTNKHSEMKAKLFPAIYKLFTFRKKNIIRKGHRRAKSILPYQARFKILSYSIQNSIKILEFIKTTSQFQTLSGILKK
jgi:hypothetical protein